MGFEVHPMPDNNPDNRISKFAAADTAVHRTPNTPLKEVLAVCEAKATWPQVISRLAEGPPCEETPTFLKQLGNERVLARKR